MEMNLLQELLTLANTTQPDSLSYTAVQAVKDYILSFSYLTQKQSLQRVKTFIDCKFSYKATLDSLSNQGIETTKGALKTSIWYVNKTLKQHLGEDIIHILKHNPDLAFRRLSLIDTNINDVLLKDTLKVIPPFDYMRYNIEDCKNELLFLAHFSKSSLDFYLKHMDKNKLSYLVHLLSEPSSEDVTSATLIVKWLQGIKKAKQEDLDRLLRVLQEANAQIKEDTENREP